MDTAVQRSFRCRFTAAVVAAAVVVARGRTARFSAKVVMASQKLKKIQPGEMIDGRWEVVELVGEGGFGAVYEVADTGPQNARARFALKMEDIHAPNAERVMKVEVAIVRKMRMKRITDSYTGKRHFCELEGVGQVPTFRYMVMTLVGKSVSQIRRQCGGKFGGRTVAHIAIESLGALKELHDIGFIHRDIKPSNLTIGQVPGYRDIYLIDFGLCRSYKHENGRLRRPRDVAGFRGTLTYASVTCHRNEDLSRRDDVWSWLYMLIELSTGKLGWYGVMRETRDLPFKMQVARVGSMKEQLNANPVELMTDCAIEFMDLHSHVSELGFYDGPNYAQLLEAMNRMQERRKQANKDGEKLEWEPGGKHHDRVKF